MKKKSSDRSQDFERRRLLAMALLEQGFSTGQVAKQLQVRQRSVQRWRAQHRAQGLQSLIAKPITGRPSRLSVQERGEIGVILSSSTQLNYSQIATLIHERFGKKYSAFYVGRLLRRIGLPRPKER